MTLNRSKYLCAGTFLGFAATLAFLAGTPAPAAAYEPSCYGTRGERCNEFTTCAGIGVKICVTNYYYWIY